MNFEQAALEHRRRYPLMQGRDWAKLCYQSEFGAGHMIRDREACLRCLEEECGLTLPDDGPLFEPVGETLCRLNLGPLHREGVSLKTVEKLFELAAQVQGTLQGLEEKLRLVMTPENSAELAAYRQAGCPAVSHSEIYREAYRPAYRLVPDWARAYWSAIRAMDKLLQTGEPVRVAIDGMSGSGKSTLGQRLNALFGGHLLHMDDFFLPADKKTPHRLAQPGGNVDHERFYDEVLAPLQKGEAFGYRPYRCDTGGYEEGLLLQPEQLTLVEGCYSLHPRLRESYDLSIFLKIDPAEQSRRILARNGEWMHRRFLEEWIPLESMYFEAFQVEDNCCLVFR